MCLVGLRLRTHAGARVLLLGNRDEFHSRPTRSADFWEGAKDVLSGLDLEAGGTWLGVTRAGRWATVTNYRAPEERRASRASRGDLVKDFLLGGETPEAYAERVLTDGIERNGFNLLLGDRDEVVYASNMTSSYEKVAPGDHVLSNHLLDTPWPKARRLRAALATAPSDDETLLAILADRTPAPDEELPDTGVGLALERMLSPMFISSPAYGTRASSLLRIDDDGRIHFVERSFGPDGHATGTRRFEL